MKQFLILRSLQANQRESSHYETKNNSRRNIFKHQKQEGKYWRPGEVRESLKKVVGLDLGFEGRVEVGAGFLGVTS